MGNNWETAEAIATSLLDGNPLAIFITAFIAFGLPVLLHVIFYRAAASPPSSNFLLLGPSGAGKTALLSLLEAKSSPRARKSPSTHTSQTSTLTTVSISPDVPIASNRFRSVNDPSLKDTRKTPIKYCVQDTPGHGKLREAQGMAQLRMMSTSTDTRTKLRGVIFAVDTAALTQDEVLRDTAAYLHDVLSVLQKRALKKGKKAAKAAAELPVLVLANKQDLFTALPPGSVREKLEAEIDRIRKSKSKGIMDAADTGLDNDEEFLGNDNGQDTFTFKLLEEEVGIKVDVVGGAVKGDDNDEKFGDGVRRWEEWVGQCL